MKSYRIAAIIALGIIVWSMTSCTTTTITTTAPDGTVTVTQTTGPAAGSLETAAIVAQVIAEK